jgi:hypothetical protein
MGKMSVMSKVHGDLTVEWDVEVSEEVEAACAKFEELQAKGYAAYRMETATQGEQIREFDKQAEKIILATPLQGG